MSPYETETGELDMTEAMRAIQRCCEAFYHVKFELSKKADDAEQYDNNVKACEAFRAELPILLGLQSYQVYTACIGKGLSIGAIDLVDSSRYLYAAQAAMAAYRLAHPPQRAGATPLPSRGNLNDGDDGNVTDASLSDRPTQAQLFKELRIRKFPLPPEEAVRKDRNLAGYMCDVARFLIPRLPVPGAKDPPPPRADSLNPAA